jgi:accessory gene regulator B
MLGLNKVTEWLINVNVINEDDRELYDYALQCWFMSFSPLLLTVIVCIFIDAPLYAVAFVIPFMVIRKYSGGYHSRSWCVCMISSVVICLAFILMCSQISLSKVFWIILLVASVLLCFLSPIESDNKSLSEEDVTLYKEYVRVLVAFFDCMVVMLSFLNLDFVAIYVGMGVILTSILQLPCAGVSIYKRFIRE